MLLRAGETTFSAMFSLRAPLDLCEDQRSSGAALTPLRLLVFLPAIVLLAEATSSAQAQVSAYGMVALTSYGFSYQNSSYNFPVDTAGLVGGAFYNFPIRSRLTAGIDGRVLYGPGSHGGTTATGALRIGFVPTRVRLRPYFELGGGVVSARLNTGQSIEYVTNGAAELIFGLDVRLTDSIDLRAIDYGAAVGPSNNNTTSAIEFLGAGVVYHFRPAEPAAKAKP